MVTEFANNFLFPVLLGVLFFQVFSAITFSADLASDSLVNSDPELELPSQIVNDDQFTEWLVSVNTEILSIDKVVTGLVNAINYEEGTVDDEVFDDFAFDLGLDSPQSYPIGDVLPSELSLNVYHSLSTINDLSELSLDELKAEAKQLKINSWQSYKNRDRLIAKILEAQNI